MQAAMTYHALFPTMVLEINNPDHEPIKQAVKENCLKWINKNGFGGESDGVNTVHHEPAFEPIYQLAVAAAKQYVLGLAIDPDTFDYYVMKSWFNILTNDHTPVHNHADSHIAFVYYVNIPDGKDAGLDFHHRENRYEPYPMMCDINRPERLNQFNAYVWTIHPKEGTMLVFPGTLRHGVSATMNGLPRSPLTDKEQFKDRRICIAGDILLVFKKKTDLDMGIQPISQWRQFG